MVEAVEAAVGLGVGIGRERIGERRYEDARKCSQEALKLGTPEAVFYYHAGMIALSVGKNREAQNYLERAIALNPKFDLSQAPIAAEQLRQLTTTTTK